MQIPAPEPGTKYLTKTWLLGVVLAVLSSISGVAAYKTFDTLQGHDRKIIELETQEREDIEFRKRVDGKLDTIRDHFDTRLDQLQRDLKSK